jgi:hypothetical protein
MPPRGSCPAETAENRPLKARHLELHELTSKDWKAVDAVSESGRVERHGY